MYLSQLWHLVGLPPSLIRGLTAFIQRSKLFWIFAWNKPTYRIHIYQYGVFNVGEYSKRSIEYEYGMIFEYYLFTQFTKNAAVCCNVKFEF